MPDLHAWLSQAHLADLPVRQTQMRAARAWRRIQGKPTTVVMKDAAGVKLAPQTVRLEVTPAGEAQSVAGTVPRLAVTVFGVRGHATLPDTAMEEGYRFVLGGEEYRCIDVVDTLGERQGIFIAIG